VLPIYVKVILLKVKDTLTLEIRSILIMRIRVFTMKTAVNHFFVFF